TAEYKATGTMVLPNLSFPFQIALAAISQFRVFGFLTSCAEYSYGNRFLHAERANRSITSRAAIARFINVRVAARLTLIVSRFKPPFLLGGCRFGHQSSPTQFRYHDRI